LRLRRNMKFLKNRGDKCFLASTGGTNLLTLLGIGGQLLKATNQIKQSSVEADVFEFNAAIKSQEAELIRGKAKLDLEVQRERL